GYRWKDSYIFCVDAEGTMLAHPAEVLVGRNLMNMPDANGKLFMPEMIDAAKKDGGGWVHYKGMRRASNANLEKHAFVVEIPGKEIMVGAGYFTPKEEKTE
ncbi:MAG: sodium:calcium antiporter, partial [Desulfobacterales bacterium]|nr:sodium:calcium antiporter [Desulfobacterales bacterium]